MIGTILKGKKIDLMGNTKVKKIKIKFKKKIILMSRFLQTYVCAVKSRCDFFNWKKQNVHVLKNAKL
jgi:hypothetical protein